MNKFLLSFFLFILSSQAMALDLKAVRLGEHPDKTRIVIETSRAVDFKAFMLNNPERLIVDLPLFVWQAGRVPTSVPAGIISVRHAVNKPGISRIVFELREPKTIKAAFQLPPHGNGNPRIVIDIGHGIGTQRAYGTLDTTGAAPSRPTLAPALSTITPSPKPPTKPRTVKKPLIVIDPGHGGNDPGAISPQRFYEKNIVLALSKELKTELESTGRYRVKLTRETDKYIRLRDRVQLSRRWGADMFISVHADSIGKSNVRGASFYTLSNTASDKQTAKLAERENRADIIAGVDLSHEDKDVANILIDLAMRDTMNQSRFFANLLIDSFKGKNVRVLPNTHRYAGFAVLKAPDVPSVLIEAGFLSNRSEADQLSQKSHRRKIIGAIRSGIDRYFDHSDDT